MFHQFYLNDFNISKSFIRNYSTLLVKLSFTILEFRSAQALALNLNKVALSVWALSISIVI